MMQLLLHRRTRIMLFGLWCLAWLFVVMLMLAPVSSPVRLSYGDLIAHFFAFAGLAFGAVSFSRRGAELTLLTGATIVGGAALELAQGLTPYRTFDVLDIAANTLGAMTGYAAGLTVLLLVIRPAAEARQAKGADA